MAAGYPCPNCGTQLQWVAQYGQYYCSRCQMYIPAAPQPRRDAVDDFFGGISDELGLSSARCPFCGRAATFNGQYNRWFCAGCQRWL